MPEPRVLVFVPAYRCAPQIGRVIRQLEGRPPLRHILAATLAGGFVSPAAEAMLDILVEVGAEFEATNRSLALAG